MNDVKLHLGHDLFRLTIEYDCELCRGFDCCRCFFHECPICSEPLSIYRSCQREFCYLCQLKSRGLKGSVGELAKEFFRHAFRVMCENNETTPAMQIFRVLLLHRRKQVSESRDNVVLF